MKRQFWAKQKTVLNQKLHNFRVESRKKGRKATLFRPKFASIEITRKYLRNISGLVQSLRIQLSLILAELYTSA